MTVDDVRKAVQEIREVAGDDERAHGLEDKLHASVLEAIAGGWPNAPELAAEALKTADIDFARWRA